MDSQNSLRPLCLILSFLSMIAGGLGMLMSFLYLASKAMDDIVVGMAGFIAGAILIAAGVISLTMIATRPVTPAVWKNPRASEFL
jgi:hypothetical protein